MEAVPVEGPWGLPEGWRWEPLGRYSADRSESINPARWPDQLFELYSVPSFDSRRPEVIAGKEIGSSKQTVQPGDVLLCKINPRINRAWVVGPATSHEQIASTEWIRFPRATDVVPEFLRHYFSMEALRSYLAMNASGVGGSLMRVKAATLASYPVPVPPLETQRRIVARIDELFSELDDGEAALGRARADLETYRKSLLKAAVTGELTADWRAANPPAETGEQLLQRILTDRKARWEANPKNKGKRYLEPSAGSALGSTVPLGWTTASVNQLTRVVRGASPRPAGDPRYFGGTIPWITVGSLTADRSRYLEAVSLFVTEAGKAASRYIEPGTLLFTNSGATLGVPKITNIGGCINDGSVALLDVEEPTKSFLYFFLLTQTERLRMLNQGAAQPNLNTGIVKDIVVPLPPIEEQARIVELLVQALEVEDMKPTDIDGCRNEAVRLRQSILAAAFRGELVQ